MDSNTKEIIFDDFCYTDLTHKLDSIKQIVNDSNDVKYKETSIQELLQDCIKMLSTGINTLEVVEKGCCRTSIIVTDLISYEIGVITSFKHCSESSLIYGDLITHVKDLLTTLFTKTSEVQKLFFNILEQVEFDFTLDGDINLLLDALKHIWLGAKTVHNLSNKIMVTNWKIYITLSQKYSTTLKENIINDEPIDFLCDEIKKTVLSFHDDDESTLKLSAYMTSVLVKLCTYGCIIKSHNILVEFILFLNSYWLPDTQETCAIKDRLLQFVDKLILISDETFVKIFQSTCDDIITNNNLNRKISALYIAMLLLRRYIKTPCDQQAYGIICIVFQLIKCTDSIMCCTNIDMYESLLINLTSVILVSDYSLFEKVEKTLITNILNTDFWPALFSSDLWIIIMRYLSSDLCNLQFSKLARLFEVFTVLPCFTQCPQHIYLKTLLKRHYSLIADKRKLVNTCPQFKIQNLKSAIGILHVPTLSKYNTLSELLKIITILPEQKNNEYLDEDIIHLWNCVRDEYPSSFICALVEISINSEKVLKTIIPKATKILNTRFIDDTTEMKLCRLRLIRSILLHTTFQENLIIDIFLEYMFDNHPLVQQRTVETIVYLSSVTKNQNKLISMIFKQPKIRTIITDYLEMKINHTYSYDDSVQYYKQLSLYGKFQHKCSFNNNLNKVLDNLKTNVDCLKDIVMKTHMSADELKKLNECFSLLNNIKSKAMQFQVENF